MSASSMPLDPFQYIGRVSRGEDGKVRQIDVIYPEESVRIEDGTEFVTFTTVIDLAAREEER